ncbi:atrial natriuretic peptide receptor 1-like [Paramacrobiotus metropolitanus]|uniref:atrial natriuretic peptide receptor 1-like n=1 Tax=Paramacrobiotus metropolitanus TaxID=2943436 RepID=UPI002446031C|nr:atrial natriuretic peptide receptor 1-like [Paramacrobiotus metropolitanus]
MRLLVAAHRSKNIITLVYFIFLLRISYCDAKLPRLVIPTVFAYDSVQHQIPWHIRGFILGVEELRARLAGRLEITHKIIFAKNVSQCADVMARVVTWASQVFYPERSKNNSVIFCSPGCFQEILQLGAVAREWNALFVTTLGSNYVVTPTTYPTIVSMSYRQQRSFAEFLMRLFHKYAWRTSMWLCDQDQTVSAFTSSTCSNAGKMMQENHAYVTNMIDFNSRMKWDAGELLQKVTTLARVIILSATADIVRKFMLAAAKLDMISGDYIFITVQELSESFLEWRLNDADDAALIAAYRALFVVTIQNPFNATQLAIFNERLAAVEQSDYIQELLRNGTIRPQELHDDTKPYNIVGYEAIIALSTVLSEAVDAGVSLNDGRSLARMFYNRYFQSNYSTFYVDATALRVSPMIVRDFDINSTLFKTVLIGEVHPEGYNLVPLNGTTIDWGPAFTQSPPDEPRCGFLNTRAICFDNSQSRTATIAGAAAGVSVTVILIGAGVAIWIYGRRKELDDKWWGLDPVLLSADDGNSYDYIEETVKAISFRPGRTYFYAGNKVFLHIVRDPIHHSGSKSHLTILNQMRELNNHANINAFLGIWECNPEKTLLVSKCCEKGTLENLLQNPSIDIDLSMQKSLIWDLLKGVAAIHASRLLFHGSLTGQKCCIDKHFALKICELGYDRLYGNIQALSRPETTTVDAVYSAPELQSRMPVFSPKVDIFSVGVIMGEILLHHDRSQQESLGLHSTTELIGLMISGKIKSALKISFPGHDDLLQTCWKTDPTMRPTIQKVMAAYKHLAGPAPTNLANIIMHRLQRYSDNLENAVAERIHDLRRQQTIVDELLCQVMPEMIVRELRAGHTVHPESFDLVTLCFTSFDGFAQFVQTARPQNVLEFLNEMVVTFDRAVTAHDVYRVEITGDSHVLASGVPYRNGTSHAAQICDIAVKLLRVYWDGAKNASELRVRAGAHSGPVVTAVVGTKLPKYSLVGDTINTASRMMSSGAASKLQISEATHKVLQNSKHDDYVLEQRGTTEIKGKGSMMTYWICPVL